MKHAVIFGGASGLAQASIKELLSHGFVVFACDLEYKETKQEGNLHTIFCDITSEESIINVRNYVIKFTDKIDVISNFAGIVTLGSLVELAPNTLDKIMAINLLGTYKTNAIFFDLIKNANGRIINISSEYAKICALPFHGYYGISKHALDIYNDSLRRELSGTKIKVICVRPGAFKTKMQQGVTNQFNKALEATKLYKKPLSKMTNLMTSELEKAKPAELFGKKYIKIVLTRHPKRVYKINNSFKMKFLSILPSSLQDFIFEKFMK
ncbi:MAG: SDR family NAD(P)-dependent oxidoreductase [Clostridia bacterium]|nr:SDR family NAD(P)-dependent oxidoreductase [Clostridia bacterium]